MLMPPRPVPSLFVLILLAVAAPGWARVAVVTTTDGRTLEGEMVRETDEVVVLSIAGIEATVPRDQVESLAYRESDRDYFQAKRAELEDDNLDGRLALVQEMVERDAIGIAESELSALDRAFPDNPQVTEKRQLIEARRSLKTGGELNAERGLVRVLGPAIPPHPAPRRARPPPAPTRTSDDDQINRLKVFEVDLDQNPRITIPRETLDTFLDTYAGQEGVPAGTSERQQFLRLSGTEQLEMFFNKQARDLYGQVQVRSVPGPLAEFRRSVNPRHVARYLAPSFGNGKVEGFNVFTSRPDSDQEAYTNFYLLTRMKFDGIPMIDRGNPQQSLLLQWGLPRDQAQHPAPDVEGWRPAFRSADDPTYLRYLAWIESLWGQDTPDYGIDYTPPSSLGGGPPDGE